MMIHSENDEVVFENQSEIWKEIPGFSRYQASSFGRIREKETSKIVETVVKVLDGVNKNTPTVMAVGVIPDEGIDCWRSVYALVCRAFHGDRPVGDNVVVNHIDGDRLNNLPENLEWSTQSENMFHSYREGLRYNNCPVNVLDIETGQTTRHYAIGDFAREFNLTASKATAILSEKRYGPWLGRYVLEYDLSERKVSNWGWVKPIVFKNYMSNQVVVCTDSKMAEVLSGVKAPTILYKVRNRHSSLTNGCVFQEFDERGNEWPEYPLVEIEESVRLYMDKPESKEREEGVLVKDYVSCSVQYCETMAEAAFVLSTGRGTVDYLIRNYPSFFRGFLVRYPSVEDDWPVYDPRVIEVARRIKKPEFPVVEVTDHMLNTTEVFAGIKDFAEHYGWNGVSVANHYRLNPGGLWKKRFSIERIPVKPLKT